MKLLYVEPVSTGMGDRIRAGIPPRYISSHSGQLSLLPSAGREIRTGQSAMVLCGWEEKYVWLQFPLVNKRVGGR